MDLEKVKIFIKDQFPEFYRDEFPQFVDFVTKYYEYISTTNYSLMDTVRDIDSSLDEYVSILKNNFAINIPEFGKLSDRDFLLFAKQFYTSRGSQDSYRFLFRAMYGKEVDILYPGESVLKPSDGIWNQEVSVRVQSSPVSHTFETGNVVTLSALDLAGKTFIFEAQDGSKSRIDCIRVNQVAINIYDIFISRSYSGKIEQNETFNYTVRFEDILDNQTVVKNLTLTGTVVPIPSKIKIYDYGQGYTTGTLYTLPAELPLRFRIKKINEEDNNTIVYNEIIQPGYASGSQFNNFYIIDSANKNFLQSSPSYYSPQTYCESDYFSEAGFEQYVKGDEFVPTSTQTLFGVEFSSTLTYPGLYTSSKGFLSDAIKLHDSNYYQSFSYVIRLDEQLESYKTLVKRLLHPAGMSLWAEYNISNNIDIRAKIANIIELLRLFVEDDVFPLDSAAIEYTLNREDNIVLRTLYAIDYFGESGVNSYIEGEDKVIFSITTVHTDIVNHQDTGLLSHMAGQSYCEPSYFAEIGLDSYCKGDDPGDRILYPGIVRTVDNDQISTVESGQLSIGDEIRYFHSGILRPVDGDVISTLDSFEFNIVPQYSDTIITTDSLTFENNIELNELPIVVESGTIAISGTQSREFDILNGILRPTSDETNPTAENGYLELIPQTISPQDYSEQSYFAEDYARGGVQYRTIHTGILRPENDQISTVESGKLVLQSYISQDIFATDYVDQDNSNTYAYGNEDNNRILYDGLSRPIDDSINVVDALSFESTVNPTDSIISTDQLAVDININNEDSISTQETLVFNSIFNKEDLTASIESGRIVVQSYVSQDIFATDYVDQDNDQTYAYGNETVFREIFPGIVNIPKDEIIISDSGRIVVQSYVSQDIFATDYVDQDNDQTYAYGNETNVVTF